nr:BBP7 family outer membrane beta-barrel protein [Fimbriiglobus sp.]
MLRHYLGGMAAALGLTGVVFAQPAVPISSKAVRPAFAQNKPTNEITQVKSDAAVPAPATPAVLPPAAAPVAPVAPIAQPIAGGCPPAFAADVATACGDPGVGCGPAMDCLCGPPGRVWLGAEYLLWTTSGNNLPPLATRATGVPVNAAPALPNTLGTLGAPGTATVIGGGRSNDDWRSGLRLYGGLWLDAGQRLGAEMDWFFLGESTSRQVAGGQDGNGFVYRPFTNNVRRNPDGTFTQVAPFQDTELVQYPNVLAGTVTVDTASRLWGLNPNAILNLACNPCGRLDFLIGYRYLNLQDDLTITENLTGLPGSANPGARFIVQDQFRTRNEFHGVNLGLAWERRFGALFLGVRGAVALGNTHTTVDIDGSTTVTTAAGATSRSVGGLLAQPSNIGRYELNRFAVVPEVGLRLGAQLTDNLRVYVGYNFLYWSNVVRTGDVVDLRVNASQLPPRQAVTGELVPRFEPRYSDFWVHGVSF